MTTFEVYPDSTKPSPATRERHRGLGSLVERIMETCLASFRQLGRSAVDGWTGQAQVEAPAAPLPVIRFTRERFGCWTVVGTDDQPRTGFADIEDAVAYARRSCDAAPATLWLNIDGLVVVVTQDSGWTRPLIGAKR